MPSLFQDRTLAYTSFFRDAEVLDAIGAFVVPWASTQPEIRIWDAGCATGEEAYSLAMIFAQRLDPFTIRNLNILATDREESAFPQFEAKIARGCYHRTDLIWVPESLRALYFLPTDDPEVFEAVPSLKECVRYKRHDLLTLEPLESDFALIVCKNVLMHCPEDTRGAVVAMFHRCLRPGGYLAFDGFQPLPSDNQHQFEQVEPGIALYRKREGAP